MTTKVIYAFVIYDQPPEFTKHTLKTISDYADQVDADLKIISDTSELNTLYPRTQIIIDKGFEFPHFYKLYAMQDFVESDYNQMMLIDDDIFVRDNAIDLFAHHKPMHFFGSQHIGQDGINHLAVLEDDKIQHLFLSQIGLIRGLSRAEMYAKGSEINDFIKQALEQTNSLLEEHSLFTETKFEDIIFLESQLRNIINSGLYVIDQHAARKILDKCYYPIPDQTIFGWYDQGYLMQKIAEARVPIQEIPPGIHANPILYKPGQPAILIDFLHFNGVPIDIKNEQIKKL
jgi:hypothetical protein